MKNPAPAGGDGVPAPTVSAEWSHVTCLACLATLNVTISRDVLEELLRLAFGHPRHRDDILDVPASILRELQLYAADGMTDLLVAIGEIIERRAG